MNSNNKKDFELTKIEDQLKMAIDSGDKNKALNLLNSLYHDSNSESKHEVENASLFGKQIYTYKEYWDMKREFYRQQIIKIGAVNDNSNTNLSENKKVETEELGSNTETDQENASANSSTSNTVIVGSYEDINTKEHLQFSNSNNKQDICYFTDKTSNIQKKLNVISSSSNKLVVQFVTSNDKYILEFKDDFNTLECTNPDKTKQIYTKQD